jgi:hypothetical protein
MNSGRSGKKRKLGADKELIAAEIDLTPPPGALQFRNEIAKMRSASGRRRPAAGPNSAVAETGKNGEPKGAPSETPKIKAEIRMFA